MIAWIKKFLGGFNPASSQNWGKWIFYAVVFTVYMTVYNRLNPPPPRQTITAQTAIVQPAQPENKKKFFVGLQLYGWGLGVYKE